MVHYLYDTIYSDQLARRINEETEFKFNETESIYWEINAKAWATNNWLTKNRERNWISLKIRFGNDFFFLIGNETESFVLHLVSSTCFLVTIAEIFGGFFYYCWNLMMCSGSKMFFQRKNWIFPKKKILIKTESRHHWIERRNFLKNFFYFRSNSFSNFLFVIKIRLKLGNRRMSMSFETCMRSMCVVSVMLIVNWVRVCALGLFNSAARSRRLSEMRESYGVRYMSVGSITNSDR